MYSISHSEISTSVAREYQYALDTYASETNKVASVWARFSDADLQWKPDAKSSTVEQILRHQLLSERRFFGEFLGSDEPDPGDTIPEAFTLESASKRLVELVRLRLDFLAGRTDGWWHERVPFFDVSRERIWVFWRRLLHTAHHRTQLALYLRMLGRPVPSIYGPTADETWSGADPTHSIEAAGRTGVKTSGPA
jgi:uncharacterized damage-inducible protein DinB